ncbi:hypothetical protein PS1_016204 [Malus domestica]
MKSSEYVVADLTMAIEIQCMFLVIQDRHKPEVKIIHSKLLRWLLPVLSLVDRLDLLHWDHHLVVDSADQLLSESDDGSLIDLLLQNAISSVEMKMRSAIGPTVVDR